MLFGDHLVVIRGGGDLGTGVAYRLWRAGFPLIVLELPDPLTVRRSVALSTAVTEGSTEVEGMRGVHAADPAEALAIAVTGKVAVLVAVTLPDLTRHPEVVVDARLAKRNIDTAISQAPLVVALGPGFTAGVDCDAVVETQRGHRLGRVIWQGSAEPNSGVPGRLGEATSERLIRASGTGVVSWEASIGDTVEKGRPLGRVGDHPVAAPTSGVVRGLIAPGLTADPGLKLGDIDPRGDTAACFTISDKSLSVGGGVLEAALAHLGRTAG